jgi:hypothetical protein
MIAPAGADREAALRVGSDEASGASGASGAEAR